MRREWIEMMLDESSLIQNESPSMRREWIEIERSWRKIDYAAVSLHAEGVD